MYDGKAAAAAFYPRVHGKVEKGIESSIAASWKGHHTAKKKGFSWQHAWSSSRVGASAENLL